MNNKPPYDQILLNSQQIENIVSNLAQRIEKTYKNIDHCLVLVVMDGAKSFAEDLLEKLDFPLTVETIKASSYTGKNSTGNVETKKNDLLKETIHNKNILLIDDIYDTGLTLSHILAWIRDCQPKSIKTCILLEKEVQHTNEVEIDFLGTKIKDVFAIGYGLDFDGQYRELPFIAELSEDIIIQSEIV